MLNAETNAYILKCIYRSCADKLCSVITDQKGYFLFVPYWDY